MIKLSPFGKRDCPTCGKVRSHSYFLVYHYFHMWYELGHVKRREYFIACNRCRHGVPVDPTEVRELDLSKDPIPFLHRRGCLLFALMILSIPPIALVAVYLEPLMPR